MKKQRYIPMPTEEEKARARSKLAKADPLVWAMKSVDDRFPDERVKNVETVKAETEVEKKMAPAPDVNETAVAEQATVPVSVEKMPDVPKIEAKEEVEKVEEPKEETLDDEEIYDDDLLDDEDMLDDENIFGDDLLDDDDMLDESEEANGTKMIDALSDAKKSRKEKETKTPEVLEGLDSEMAAEKEVAVVKKVEKTENDDDAKEAIETVETKPAAKEIKAEGKLAVPMNDGVIMMEVTPMRQDVSNVSPEEVKAKAHKEEVKAEEAEAESEVGASEIDTEEKMQAKAVNNANDGKMQVKLTSLESKQKKMLIGIIALVVLAIGGVVFGLVATVRQNKTVEELVSQISMNGNSEDKDVDEEYIYIKDWGLKIKIIAGLNNVSYNALMDDYAEVQIWGSKRDSGANYVPDFAKQNRNGNPLGTVVRVPRYERAAAGRLIWYDDYYNYYYQGPSGVPTVSEEEMSWWVESYLLIKEMLTNADNYTSLEDATIGQQ